MAAKLYVNSISATIAPNNPSHVFLAMTLFVLDSTFIDCVFVQTDDLAEKEVGVTEYGGAVLQITSDNDDDELTFVAIPKDEYPDDTNKMTFTVTRETLLTLGAGSEVVDPSP